MLGRLLLAALLGGLIGLEREMSDKPAGLRTNLLICLGAALLMELSIDVAALANAQGGDGLRADPARIAAQVVSGIGFIGAGTILQAHGSVTGLTTAATIWVVAAIGMAVGSSAYVEAVGSAILVGISLVMFGRVEDLVTRRRRTQHYHVVLDPDPELLRLVEDTFRERGLRILTESVDKTGDEYRASFDVAGHALLHDQVIRSLAARPGIRRLSRED